MINRVVIAGRLTKDPELRYTPSGLAVVRFTLAVNRQFKTEGQPEADFVQCVAWRKQAENLANYQKKGSLIGVDGRIQTGSFEGQDGKRIYTTEVVADSIQFLEPRGSSEGGNAPQNNNSGYNQQQNAPGGQGSYGSGGYQNQQRPPHTRVDEDPFADGKGPVEVSEDDLPF